MMRCFFYALSLLLVQSLSVQAQVCNGVFGAPLLFTDFGQGNTAQTWYGPLATYAPGLSTNTTFVTSGGLSAANVSGLVRHTSAFGSSPSWTQRGDHTGNTNGLLFGINMPDNIGDTVVEYIMTDLCPNTTLEFSVWLLNLMARTNGSVNNPNMQRPNIIMRIINPVNGAVLASYTSGNIPVDESWHYHSVVFSNGSSSSIRLQIINNTQGSNLGNDLAFDDIMVRPCVPALTLAPNTDTLLCDASSFLLTADITPGIYTPPVYEWEFRDANTSVWQTGQSGPGSSWNFSPGSKGEWWVRYKVFPAGVSGNTSCMVVSDSVKITFGERPVIDLGPDIAICADSVELSVSDGDSWIWSNGSADDRIMVTASDSYWVMASDSFGCTSSDSIYVDLGAALSVDLGPDLGICDKDFPVILTSPQDPGTNYLWSNGFSYTEMTIVQGGVYWLEVERDGCTGSDTITVTEVPTPVLDLGPDTAICEQLPLEIGNYVYDATYLWNTGATTPYIHAATTGVYTLTVDRNGCIVHDTVSITAMPDPDTDLGNDGDICPEQTLVLDGSYGGNSRYEWNTGETTPSISVTEAGTYSVTVTTEHKCVGGDTITLSYYPKPVVSLGADTTVCEETPLYLSAWALNTDSLLWSDGSVSDRLLIRYGGAYIVTAINKCGTGSDTIEVRQIFCDIWLPNAFTPNGDGVNDVFRILGNIGRMEGVTLSIFNRWGARVFVTNDKLEGWDGSYKGIAAQLGTYVYLLQYSIDSKPYQQQGNFHLLR